MKKCFAVMMLVVVAATGFAEAGQYQIAPPGHMRKRQPPRNYRESRLEIVNRDNRGYAIDVDYRRNRLTLESRDRGDIFIPGNSSVFLTFDDDDDWHIFGDHESMDIEIRSGRTTRLILETRMDRNRTGLFGTVENGRRYTRQLFHYADRPGHGGPSRPQHNPPPPPQPQPPHNNRPQPNQPPHGGPGGPGGPGRNEPSVGNIVGNVLDRLIDDGPKGPPRR